MQTFHPYLNHELTAKSLDYRRLGKQRVECKQILRALLGMTTGWVHHPVTRRWSGYERELCRYALVVCEEWISRGYQDSLRPYFQDMLDLLSGFSEAHPPWLNEEFCQGHKILLYRKNPIYYSSWGVYGHQQVSLDVLD